MRNQLLIEPIRTSYAIENQKIFSDNDGLPLAASDKLPEILFITSYPPRECGIAT